MVDVLSSSANPKHRNSKFLKFLNKLNHGAYAIEDNQLVKNQEKIKEFREIDTQRREREMLEAMQQQEQPGQDMEQFTNILEGAQEEGESELDSMNYDQMMKEWMKEGNDAQGMSEMMGEWQNAWANSM